MARLLMVSVVLVVVSAGLAAGFLQTTRRYSTSNFNIFRTTTRRYTHTTPQYPYGPTSDWAFWTRRTTSTPPPTADWFWSRRTTSTPPPTADWFWTRRTTTMPPTTTRLCPYACTFRGVHYCYPLPCHITCVDGNRPPGACCYECPNGGKCLPTLQDIYQPNYVELMEKLRGVCGEKLIISCEMTNKSLYWKMFLMNDDNKRQLVDICETGPNCSYNGHIIPEGQYMTTSSGAQAHCLEGGPTGGNVDVRQSTTP